MYKYCIVPCCINTTIKTPDKVFFSVPKDALKRKQWCNAMKRDNIKNKKLSCKTTLFCCEDHFSLQDDMENFWQFSLTKDVKKLKLKPEVVPHIFLCQENKKPVGQRKTLPKTRKYIVKKKREELVMECLNKDEVEVEEEASTSETVPEVEELTKEKGVQTTIKPPHRSKGVDATVDTTTTATSPIRQHFIQQTSSFTMTSPLKAEYNESACSSMSDYEPESEIPSENFSSEEEIRDTKFKELMIRGSTMSIQKYPKLYLGLPEESAFLINILVRYSRLEVRDVYIVLKKIRLNDSFAILAVDFGMSKSNTSRIFTKSLGILARLMEVLIIWPSEDKVMENLPIPFRARYGKVVSIIDCLEIEIEKPTDPVHQGLTWSNYKKCNTLKYLISCTPNGLTNFISCGYGGRTSDAVIVEDCTYLEKLKQGNHIMADRGFKHVSSLLQEKGCTLVRPPSVQTSVKSSKTEVKLSKQIAALRIHVERVIGRLREFRMLLPHSCIDRNLIRRTDSIIKIACGIINLQSQLIKN